MYFYIFHFSIFNNCIFLKLFRKSKRTLFYLFCTNRQVGKEYVPDALSNISIRSKRRVNVWQDVPYPVHREKTFQRTAPCKLVGT